MKKRIISLALSLSLVLGLTASAAAADEKAYEPVYEPGITHEMMDDLVTGLNGLLETELWVNVIDKTVYTNYTIGLLYDFSLQGMSGMGITSNAVAIKEFLTAGKQMTNRPYAAVLDTIPDDMTDVYARDENGVPYLTTLNYGVTDEASFFARFNEWFHFFYDMWFGYVGGADMMNISVEGVNTIWSAVNTFAADWLGLKAQIAMPAEGLVPAEAVTAFISAVVAEVRADTVGTLLRALPLLAQDEHLQVLGTFLNAVYPKITALLGQLGVEGLSLPEMSADWVEPVADSQVPNLLYDIIAMPGEGQTFDDIGKEQCTLAMQGLAPMVGYLASALIPALGVELNNQVSMIINAIGGMPELLNSVLGGLLTDNMATPIPQTCTHRLNLEGVLNTILNEVPMVPGPDGENVPLGITLTGMDLENKLGAMATPADAGDVLKVVLDYLWPNLIVDEDNFNAVLVLVDQLMPGASAVAKPLIGLTPAQREANKTILIPMVASMLSGKEYPDEPTTDPEEPSTDPEEPSTDAEKPSTDSEEPTTAAPAADADQPDTGDSALAGLAVCAAGAGAVVVCCARRRRLD